jgi:hypothetical protein
MTVRGIMGYKGLRAAIVTAIALVAFVVAGSAFADTGTMLGGYGGSSSTPNVVVPPPPVLTPPSVSSSPPPVQAPQPAQSKPPKAQSPPPATTAGVSATQPAPRTAGTSETLPFTGLDVGLILGAGVVLLGVGIALRRSARRES